MIPFIIGYYTLVRKEHFRLGVSSVVTIIEVLSDPLTIDFLTRIIFENNQQIENQLILSRRIFNSVTIFSKINKSFFNFTTCYETLMIL